MPATSNFVPGLAVPMPTELAIVVRETMPLLSVKPGVRVPVMVSFLLEVSSDREMPVPFANSKVSVFDPAENELEPALIVPIIFWADPKSELLRALPEIASPEPKVMVPVDPPTDNTPVLAMVGVWPLVTLIPLPAVTL